MTRAPYFVDTPEGRTWFDPALGEDFRRFLAAEIRQRQAAASEAVRLTSGEVVDQTLLAGVPPVSLASRDVAALRAEREAQRGHEPLPVGSLFDSVARDQMELF